MSVPSDLAELSSLRTQTAELTARVLAIADRYGATPDSAVAADLYAAERGLVSAGRSLDRARSHLVDLP